jgi:hypothetical protein
MNVVINCECFIDRSATVQVKAIDIFRRLQPETTMRFEKAGLKQTQKGSFHDQVMGLEGVQGTVGK